MNKTVYTDTHMYILSLALALLIHNTQTWFISLGGYITNLSDFYSYSLIGKLTTFLKLQEFILCKQIVDSSTTTARFSLNSSKGKLV
jgi:hypothetical protein